MLIALCLGVLATLLLFGAVGAAGAVDANSGPFDDEPGIVVFGTLLCIAFGAAGVVFLAGAVYAFALSVRALV